MSDTARKVDHDNDTGNIRPRAWKKAKDCFAKQFYIADLMRLLEVQAGDANVRLLLAISIHQYLTASREERCAALYNYHDWCDRSDGDDLAPLAPMPSAERLRSSDRATSHDMLLVKKKIMLE